MIPAVEIFSRQEFSFYEHCFHFMNGSMDFDESKRK